MKFIFSFFLCIAMTSLWSQKTATIDFSSRIAPVNRITTKSNVPLLTAREYRDDIGGTLVVTGYVHKDKVFLASVKLEVPAGKTASRAQAMLSGGCDKSNDCSATCGKSSDVIALLCVGACLIFCP